MRGTFFFFVKKNISKEMDQLEILSTYLDRRLSSNDNKDIGYGLCLDAHELETFVDSHMPTCGNPIDFFLKCWRVLFKVTHTHGLNPIRIALTYEIVYDTMVNMCVDAKLLFFQKSMQEKLNNVTTYQNAYAILKRTHDILASLKARPIRELEHRSFDIAKKLQELQLDNRPDPPPQLVMDVEEWLFLLRSWFRWNKQRFPNIPLLKPNIDNDTFIQTLEDVCVQKQKEDEEKVCVNVNPLPNIPSQMLQDVALNQTLQQNIDDFLTQTNTSFCCCIDNTKKIIFTKYGRLTAIQKMLEDKLSRIQILTHVLQKTFSVCAEKDRFFLALSLNTEKQLVDIDILAWNDIPQTHKEHCFLKTQNTVLE